jgi:hypothetical protein
VSRISIYWLAARTCQLKKRKPVEAITIKTAGMVKPDGILLNSRCEIILTG